MEQDFLWDETPEGVRYRNSEMKKLEVQLLSRTDWRSQEEKEQELAKFYWMRENLQLIHAHMMSRWN